MADAFLIVDVPAQATLIGGLTARHPGCTLDLLGRPVVEDARHYYDLDYRVCNVPPEGKADLEAHEDEVYDQFETIAYDPEQRTWAIRARVPVENIRSEGLRFIAGLFGLAPMPWLRFADGIGQARLKPGRPEAIAQIAETLSERLRSIGVDNPVRVETGDWTQRFAARIQEAGWSHPSP